MGIIARASELLDEHRFRAAQDQTPDEPGGWTLLDLLMTAAGAHRLATPVAYWQSRELRAAISGSWDLVKPVTEDDPRVWSNQAGRTSTEIRDALYATDSDVESPPELTLRPGSTPDTKSTCKIPFVPTVAVTHAWILLGGSSTVADLIDSYGICPGTDSWQLLDLIDPVIGGLETPPSLVDQAQQLARLMKAAEPEIPTTARLLHAIARTSPGTTLTELSTLSSLTGETAEDLV